MSGLYDGQGHHTNRIPNLAFLRLIVIQTMHQFKRTKKDSLVYLLFSYTFFFIISAAFTVAGFLLITLEERKMGYVLLCPGIFLLALLMRAFWKMRRGRPTHLLCINDKTVTWGFIGEEKSLSIADIENFYWSDWDSFHFGMRLKNGKNKDIPYIENVVTDKCRPRLLSYLRESFPQIPIKGTIKTDTI
ncbi:MAG: hypothetical protein AAF571_10940 [Verrucomicrobiota bacterium]